MNLSRKLKALVAGTCLAVAAGGVTTAMLPGTAGASTEVSTSTSSGAHPFVRLHANCRMNAIGVDVMVDKHTTPGWDIWFRGYYVKWQRSGTGWINRGSTWINGGNWQKGSASLLADYNLGAFANVPSGYTYTLQAEVFVPNYSDRYYQASTGEYFNRNGYLMTTAGCTY